MPIRRGHIAPENTYIDTLIRKFNSQNAKFIIANAVVPNKPIIFCNDGFCQLFNFTKGQILLKSASLSILRGPETSEFTARQLTATLYNNLENEISINLYDKERNIIPVNIVIAPVRDETGNIPLHILFFRREGQSYVEDQFEGQSDGFRAFRFGRIHDYLCKCLKSEFYSSSSSNQNNSVSRKQASHDSYFEENMKNHRIFSLKKKSHRKSHCNTQEVNELEQRLTNSYKQPSDASDLRSNDQIRNSNNSTINESSINSGETSNFRDKDNSWTSQKERDLYEENRIKKLENDIGKESNNLKTIQTEKLYQTKNRSFNLKRSPNQNSNTNMNRAESCSGTNQLASILPIVSFLPTGAGPVGNSNNNNNTSLAHHDAPSNFRLVLSTQAEHNKSHVTEKFAQILSMDEDVNLEHRLQSTRMHKYIIKHYSPIRAFWDWFILLLVTYTVVCTPFAVTFLLKKEHNYEALHYIDILVDAMFLIDILINFRTTYVNHNDEVVSSPKKIAAHYLKGWFIIDLLAAIPFDLLFTKNSSKDQTALIGLLKSARFLRLVGVMRKIDRYSEYGWAILLLLTAGFALIAHWFACMWYAIGSYELHERTDKIGWLYSLANQTHQFYSTNVTKSGPNIHTKYITALYFTFSSLTSIGFGNVSPNTNPEKIFSIIVMLFGSLMYATIFGNVSAIIQRFYSGTTRFHMQISKIKEFIRFNQIPNPIRQRLEEYFKQAWAYTNGIDMTNVQKSFPECLQTDICAYVYRNILLDHNIFLGASEGCLRNVSLKLKAMHIPPGDTIIYQDGLLNSLLYVAKGSLEILDSDDGSILALLNERDFIGGLPPLFHPRSCDKSYSHAYPVLPPPAKSRFTVRALTFVDIHYIDRDDLAELMALYPDISDSFIQYLEFTFPLADSMADWNEEFTMSNNLKDDSIQITEDHPDSERNEKRNLCECQCHHDVDATEAKTNHSYSHCPPWEVERITRIVNHSGTWFTTLLPEHAFDEHPKSRNLFKEIYRKRYECQERFARKTPHNIIFSNVQCKHDSSYSPKASIVDEEEGRKRNEFSDQISLLQNILGKITCLEKEITKLDVKTDERLNTIRDEIRSREQPQVATPKKDSDHSIEKS